MRRGSRLTATATGGRQERNRCAGTENVPSIVGLGEAARLATEKLATEDARVGLLRDRLEAGILTVVPGTVVNGDCEHRVPNTTNISFDRVEAESLLIALDLEGIAVSTGSACSSGALEPSHVLRAMGFSPHRTQHAIRFSLGMANTADQIDRVVAVPATGRREAPQPVAFQGARRGVTVARAQRELDAVGASRVPTRVQALHARISPTLPGRDSRPEASAPRLRIPSAALGTALSKQIGLSLVNRKAS